jgi:hypothetical protein
LVIRRVAVGGNNQGFNPIVPLGREQIEKLKMQEQLYLARQRGKKAQPIACKRCGNRVMIKQELCEIALVKYPKMLGLDLPEVEVHDHRLSLIYVCAKCMTGVVEFRQGNLFDLQQFDGKPIPMGIEDDNARIEAPGEHASGSDQEQEPVCDSPVVRDPGGQGSESPEEAGEENRGDD